jgi:mRNA interferase RelE/StbE
LLPLRLSKAAVRSLDDLPPKQYRQVARRIISLMADPRPHDSERLKGHDYLRVTVGEYRIVYQVGGEELHVLLIGKRNDDEVYRRLR